LRKVNYSANRASASTSASQPLDFFEDGKNQMTKSPTWCGISGYETAVEKIFRHPLKFILLRADNVLVVNSNSSHRDVKSVQ
jgi:hypothetical protein